MYSKLFGIYQALDTHTIFIGKINSTVGLALYMRLVDFLIWFFNAEIWYRYQSSHLTLGKQAEKLISQQVELFLLIAIIHFFSLLLSLLFQSTLIPLSSSLLLCFPHSWSLTSLLAFPSSIFLPLAPSIPPAHPTLFRPLQSRSLNVSVCLSVAVVMNHWYCQRS